MFGLLYSAGPGMLTRGGGKKRERISAAIPCSGRSSFHRDFGALRRMVEQSSFN